MPQRIQWRAARQQGIEEASQSRNTPKRTKELAKRTIRSSPLKNGGVIVPRAKQRAASTLSHGGTIKPFKPPALDVQPVRGQKFTSLKNLEAAAHERQKQKGKTKI